MTNIAKMTMTVAHPSRPSTRIPRYSFILKYSLALALAVGSSSAALAQVACMVNGDPITNYDIEQRSKLLMLSTHKAPDRQQVVNELIDEKVKLKEGKKFSIDPSVSDVDQSYNGMAGRMRITPEALTKSLESQGVRPDTLKARIKTDMVWSNLVRGRYKESLQVGEKDVEEKAKEQGDEQKPEAAQGIEYKMQPIVLIVPRGSGPEVTESRKKEAEALRARIQSCTEANAFFKAMPNAAIRESVTKTSADIPQPLREVLDGMQIGHLTPPEVTKQGVEMVALCAREPTKVDTPKKKEIREKLFAEKYEAKSKSYLREARKASMIECH
jgi:peptidyl-prolyl cis-trans isomerase SurA